MILTNIKSKNIHRFATSHRRLVPIIQKRTFLTNHELRIEVMKLHPYRTYSHFGLNISTMLDTPRHYHFPEFRTKYVPLKRSESVDCYFSSPDLQIATVSDTKTKFTADIGLNILSEIVDRSLDIYFTKHDTVLAEISPIKDDLLKIFEDQLRNLKTDATACTFLNKLSDINYSKLSLSGAACPNLDADKFTKVWDCIPYIEFGDNQNKSYASIIDSTVKSIESETEGDDFSKFLNNLNIAQEGPASGSKKVPAAKIEKVMKTSNSISSSTPSSKSNQNESKFVSFDISNVSDDNNNSVPVVSKENAPISRPLSRIPVFKYRCRCRHQTLQPLSVEGNSKTRKSGQRLHMTKKKSIKNYIAENIQKLSRPNNNSIKAKSTDSIPSLTCLSLKKKQNHIKSSSIDEASRMKNNEEFMFQDLNRDSICISQQIDRQAILIGQMDLSKAREDCQEIFLLHKNLEQDLIDRQMLAHDMAKEIDRIRDLNIMD
jgi:hypothetical protein